ncbi:MAG: hypothetical protein Q4D85_01355 [Corynebacterium sp.]|uniref:hypothetical protein n=1 Tax=Corynebacterium sp. TaxID=1720 RepID=UPI0026DBC2A3|nr:hypothetical protein [Corynebacterium sp.]MDO5097374.1 hypothetical protein [Corynebacterium sp.]
MTTPAPKNPWHEAAARIRRTSFQYAILTAAPDATQVVALESLNDSETAADLAAKFHEQYQPSHLYKAGSLAFQRAAHRLLGISVGCWLLDGTYLQFSPEHTQLIVKNGAVTAVLVDPENPPTLVRADAKDVVNGACALITPMMAAVSQATGVGSANLTGNCAATIGAVARNIVRHYPDRDPNAVKYDAEELFRNWPGMSRLGWFETIGGKLFYYRNSCCHWHSTGADNCDWCTKRPVPERRQNFAQSARQTS